MWFDDDDDDNNGNNNEEEERKLEAGEYSLPDDIGEKIGEHEDPYKKER